MLLVLLSIYLTLWGVFAARGVSFSPPGAIGEKIWFTFLMIFWPIWVVILGFQGLWEEVG